MLPVRVCQLADFQALRRDLVNRSSSSIFPLAFAAGSAGGSDGVWLATPQDRRRDMSTVCESVSSGYKSEVDYRPATVLHFDNHYGADIASGQALLTRRESVEWDSRQRVLGGASDGSGWRNDTC